MNLEDLLRLLQSSLQLDLLCQGPETSLGPVAQLRAGSSVSRHRHRIMVIGGEDELEACLLLAQGPDGDVRMVVLSEGVVLPEHHLRTLAAENVAVAMTHRPANEVVDTINFMLHQGSGAKSSIYGVLLDVYDVGVLLLGEAGVGKSELALELVTRGHKLVADDVVDFSRASLNVVVGSAPGPLRNFLEVRGVGVLNIRELYGVTAVAPVKALSLVMELKRMSIAEMAGINRLEGALLDFSLLGMVFPKLILPVTPGRNLAVLVEVAVRKHMLEARGEASWVSLERQLVNRLVDD